MKAHPQLAKSLGSILAVVLTATVAHSQVIANFSGGNGNSSSDQYVGNATGGWNTAWVFGSGSQTSSASATVITDNVNPLAGGGNYLSVNYTANGSGSTANQYALVSRQVSTSSINLASTVTYSFTLRPDSAVSNANETFAIFTGGSANPTGNSGTDTWRLNASGGGWSFQYGNGAGAGTTAATQLGAPGNMLGSVFRFTIISDSVARTFSATILNVTNGQTVSYSNLAWRSPTATAEGSFLNFASASQFSSTTAVNPLAFSLDSISIANVPEPSSFALTALGAFTLLAARRRQLTLSQE